MKKSPSRSKANASLLVVVNKKCLFFTYKNIELPCEIIFRLDYDEMSYCMRHFVLNKAVYTSSVIFMWKILDIFPFQCIGEEATGEKESYWWAKNTEENQDKIKSWMVGELYQIFVVVW